MKQANLLKFGLLWLITTPCFAGEVVLNFRSTYDYMVSPYYECKVSDQRILKSASGADRTCLVNVQCIPTHFKDKLKERTPVLSCDIHNGACQEAFVCARNVAKVTSSGKNEWSSAPIATAAANTTNPFKDNCKYGDKQKGMFQFQGTTEKRCVRSYSCDKAPKPRIVACEATQEHRQDVCPQVNDCLTKPISLATGYTHKELDEMSADQKAAALREMDHGPESVDLTSVSIHADPMTAEAEVHP